MRKKKNTLKQDILYSEDKLSLKTSTMPISDPCKYFQQLHKMKLVAISRHTLKKFNIEKKV